MYDMRKDDLKSFIKKRLAALDEWHFTEKTTIDDIKGAAAAQAFGRYWELTLMAERFFIDLKE
jgi:hypothetical protein